jgi:hypothetical protein
MKAGYALLWIVFVSMMYAHQACAQIPNAGFENWTAGNPDNWSTSNDSLIALNITQTSAAHSAPWAVHGVVATFGGTFPWPPMIMSGPNAEGFPVSTQYPALHGWYKLSPLSGDELMVTVGMTQADTTVGVGLLTLSAAQTVYREFVATILYPYPQTPDTCLIVIGINGPGGGLPHAGSAFDVDDLAFGPASAVDESGNVIPTVLALSQNYPNPFNPKTQITYSLPHTRHVRLAVFNTLGQEIALLIDAQQEAGVYRAEFNGEHLPSGTYFYRLQAGEFSQVKKLLLVK